MSITSQQLFDSANAFRIFIQIERDYRIFVNPDIETVDIHTILTLQNWVELVGGEFKA